MGANVPSCTNVFFMRLRKPLKSCCQLTRSNLYLPLSVTITSALYLFCSCVVAESAFTIVAISMARCVPIASKPPLKMSHAEECCVSALFECTPKSS